jgi:UDP-glucuronate 4-epimerase
LISVVPEEGNPVMAEGVTDSLSSVAPWRVVNIAGGRPVGLMRFIEAIEKAMGKKAEKRMLAMQQGDVVETFADPRLLKALTNFSPAIGVDQGVRAFVDWYRDWSTR